MTELVKAEDNLETKRRFDTACKGPRLGKSFNFVPVPEIRIDSVTEKVEDGLSMWSFSSKKLDTMDPKDIEKASNDIDYKGIMKKQTMRTMSLNAKENAKENKTNSPSTDGKKKYIASILRKSKYADTSDSRGGGLERGTTITDKSAPKNKLTFKEEIQEVKVVENWKIYNQETYTSTNTCYCNTF